jgi:hypothetical protein
MSKHEIRVGNVYLRYPQDRICEVLMVVVVPPDSHSVRVRKLHVSNLQTIDRDVIEHEVGAGNMTCVRYGPVGQCPHVEADRLPVQAPSQNL